MDSASKTQISLRLPEATVETFDRIAEALDRNRTWVMLHAFNRFLKSEGAVILREAESIAALKRGEGFDFDKTMEEVEAIIAGAGEKA